MRKRIAGGYFFFINGGGNRRRVSPPRFPRAAFCTIIFFTIPCIYFALRAGDFFPIVWAPPKGFRAPIAGRPTGFRGGRGGTSSPVWGVGLLAGRETVLEIYGGPPRKSRRRGPRRGPSRRRVFFFSRHAGTRFLQSSFFVFWFFQCHR
jgi:hypothetical protein